MCVGKSRIEIKVEYTIDDLPKFFKDRSKAISKKFSNERFKISTIRSKKIGDNNKFSFNLKLLSRNEEQFLIKPVVDFFRICLSHGEDYKIDMVVPEQIRDHCANNSYSTVEQCINGAPSEILSHVITIELQTNIKDIDLSKLNQIDLHLSAKSLEKEVSQGTNGGLVSGERAEQTENIEELDKTELTKKGTEQKKTNCSNKRPIWI